MKSRLAIISNKTLAGLVGLSIVLTAVFGFSAGAQAQSACAQVHGAGIQKYFQVEQRIKMDLFWNDFYMSRVSPAFKKGWERDIQGYYFPTLWVEKENNAPEIKVLEALGFEVSLEKGRIEIPDFNTVVVNYERYLDSQGISQKQRIMPALILEKIGGETPEYSMLVPGRDPWPLDSGYKVKLKERLKSRLMVNNISVGRYPLWVSGIHDIYHLITFALYPKYAQALKEGHAQLLKKKLSSSALSRAAYMLEILTLGNPKKLDEIKKNLTIADPKSTTEFAEFHQAVENLSRSELDSKAKFWIENFQSFLIRYSGGSAESYERAEFKKSINGDARWLELFQNGRAWEGSKIMPDYMIAEGMVHMDVFLEKVNKWSEKSPELREQEFRFDGRSGEKEQERILRLLIARMEYGLWKSATEIDVETWAKDTMVTRVDMDSPTMKFIKDVFGEQSLTYRLFKDAPPKLK